MPMPFSSISKIGIRSCSWMKSRKRYWGSRQRDIKILLTIPEYKGKKTGFIEVKSRFRKKIVPGDRLDVEAELHRFRRGLAQGISKGYVKGELACQAELQIAIPDVMLQYRPVGGK